MMCDDAVLLAGISFQIAKIMQLFFVDRLNSNKFLNITQSLYIVKLLYLFYAQVIFSSDFLYEFKLLVQYFNITRIFSHVSVHLIYDSIKQSVLGFVFLSVKITFFQSQKCW